MSSSRQAGAQHAANESGRTGDVNFQRRAPLYSFREPAILNRIVARRARGRSTIVITVSVVSHRQNALVNQLLSDLQLHCRTPLKLLLTQNVADEVPLIGAEIQIITNQSPKGFGANHNAAFHHCEGDIYCVVNPDIRLDSDPFPVLQHTLHDAAVGVVGPLVRDPSGNVEDSARHFPNASSLARKLFRRQRGPDYPPRGAPAPVDWVAGMFMAFRSDAFRAVGGFDERFFLYYEDVDICRRLRARGLATLYCPSVSVIHDARRASRRNLGLMAIHAASAARYLARRYR